MTPPAASKQPEMTRVYILRFRLPVGLSLKSRKLDKDQNGEHLRYRYEFEMRRKVMKLRAHYRHLAFRYSIPFHGLRIVRGDDLAAIEKFAGQANEQFAALDSSFRVQATPIPIDLNPNRKGGIESAIHDAAASHIYGRVIERLERLSKKGKDLPETSRRSLLKLTDELKQWNILGSEDITTKLDEMARKFAVKTVAPVLEDLEEQVKKFSSEGAWVEL